MKEPEKLENKVSFTKKCIVCEKEFIAFHNKALYCSSSCSQKSYRERNYLNSWQKDARNALLETNIENSRLRDGYNQISQAYLQKLEEIKILEEKLKVKTDLINQQMALLKDLTLSRNKN